MMEKPARGERQQATRSFDTGGFLNVSGSVVGDYRRTSVDGVCSNCARVVSMKVTTANLICPECKHKVFRWRSEPSQTVFLSERDVARILQAVATMEGWKEYEDPQHPPTSIREAYNKGCIGIWNRTPEGWPVPSRRLMEEIKKLL